MSTLKLKYAFISITLAVACIVVFGFIVVEYTAKNALYYPAICPRRVDLSKYAGVTPRKLGYRYKNLTVTADNSIVLKGWFVYAKKKHPKGTVFILHGIKDSKFSMPGLMNHLCDRGFNCVLFDNRAHGESGGKYCSFGYFEKHDYSKILDYVAARFPSSAPYAIMGHSLGAAISVQAMAIDKRFKCGIIQSCFNNYRQIVHDYFRKTTKFRADFLVDMSLNESERRVHYKVDEISPEKSALEITAPVMCIHGLKDDDIPPEYGKRVFNNMKSKVKIWYPVPGADHNTVSKAGGDKYYRAITDFLIANLH